jgi:serine/threonine-protein kinase
VAIQHINSSPVAPHEINPDAPEMLEKIALKAMNPDINERYQTADELLADLETFRKVQTGAIPAVVEPEPEDTYEEPYYEDEPQEEYDSEYEDEYDDDFSDMIVRGVSPVSRSGERSYDAYVRRRTRSKKVSMLTGFFLVLVFMTGIFVFLWNYWLKDIFEEPDRINMPNFVGDYWADIRDSEEFNEVFNFTVTYSPSSDYAEGYIMSQDPSSNRSVMSSANGISVSLVVSSGIQMVKVPEVYNEDYRTAVKLLEDEGFKVKTEYVESNSVNADYAVSTSPAAGESLTYGATVYLQISGGPHVDTFEMPNLIGMTQEQAEATLEQYNLSLGSVTTVSSEYTAGVVVWQSEDAGEEVTAHTKIYLQVSLGPNYTTITDADAASQVTIPEDNVGNEG